MNRQCWNWCDRIKNFGIGCINIDECPNDFISCQKCWSLHYPAKREGCWIVEEIVIYDDDPEWYIPIRDYFVNPQGVKHDYARKENII